MQLYKPFPSQGLGKRIHNDQKRNGRQEVDALFGHLGLGNSRSRHMTRNNGDTYH